MFVKGATGKSKTNYSMSRGKQSLSFRHYSGLWIEAIMKCYDAWWRHQMEALSVLLVIYAGNSPVPGEFPTQSPVTRSFDVFFDLRHNKRLSK